MAFDVNIKIIGSVGIIAILIWAIVTLLIEAANLENRTLGAAAGIFFILLLIVIAIDADITYKKLRY